MSVFSDQQYRTPGSNFIVRLFLSALAVRVALVVFFQITELDRTLRLTKDGFFYDRIGKEIAEYYRTDGMSAWPARVKAVVDFLYEHIVGIVYYMTGDSMLVMGIINALAGALIPVVVWRMANYITDVKTSRRAALWAAWFPTQLYYSCLPVRDGLSTLAVTCVFLGVVAFGRKGKAFDKWILLAGLAATAGFRAYVFSVVTVIIPIAWGLVIVVTRSVHKRRLLRNALILGGLASAVAVNSGLLSAFSSGKAAYVTDIDYWNKIRGKMNRGAGALYSAGEVPEIGESLGDTVSGIAVGFYFFFLSVNPLEISSFRQAMALPEALAVLYVIPSIARGVRRSLRYHAFSLLPLLLIAGAITFGYSSTTTNGGPLMRWRLQVVNVYILVAAIGFSRNYYLDGYERGSLAPTDEMNAARLPLGRPCVRSEVAGSAMNVQA